MGNTLGKLKKLTSTEILLLGTAVILLILIIMRWEWVWNELSDSFTRIIRPKD